MEVAMMGAVFVHLQTIYITIQQLMLHSLKLCK